MFLTETDLINLKLTAEKAVGESDMIKNLIQDDIASVQKKLIQQGEKYYVGEHDIYNVKFNECTISETDDQENEQLKRFSNPNRSNHHNVNPFHRILVDQKVAYLLGREPSITVDGATDNSELKEYEKFLSEFCDEYFDEVLQELAIGASNKGFEVLHVYYNTNGEFKYCIVPAEETILIYDTEYQTELEQVVRYYNITVVRDGKKFIRKKVEWWTKNDVTYYIENDEHNYPIDTNYVCNPSPHWWEVTLLDGYEKRRIPHSWGRVPFIVLKNNIKMTTDLQLIKGLIDAYDLLSSQGTNNFIDLVELYWAIEGYGGEEAGALVRKLQINKAVSVSGTGGKIESKQVELPVSGRIEFLKMLRRDIFHFGMGIDVDADKFGSAPSGVSLKFQYAQLDLKVNTFIPKLKSAIKELLWFTTQDYNRRTGKTYDVKTVNVSINKTMITNDLETVQMISASKGIVSDKTLLARHPFVDDVNNELLEIEAQEKAALEGYGGYDDLGDGHE